MDDLIQLADDLSEDNLPESFRFVAAECGMHAAVSLIVNLPGIPLDIPKAGLTSIRKLYIQEHFNGFNALSLAVRLGIDAREVKRLAKIVEKHPISTDLQMPNEHTKKIDELCGRDVAIIVIERFPNKRIYVPTGGLFMLKKRYVEKFFKGNNSLDLAIKLRVSQQFVRKVISDYHDSRVVPMDLFRSNG